VGYALSTSVEPELTVSALRMAIPERNPLPGCIHHSDQGLEYAYSEYINLLKEHKFQISMASRGNPYENAHVESFIKTLKCEEVYLGLSDN
jgi:putative transposase